MNKLLKKNGHTFAVYAVISLTESPVWFDSIWQKYRGSRPPYVTLKQTCFVKENDIHQIQLVLEKYLCGLSKGEKVIELEFKTIHTEPHWPIIMIDADTNSKINKLQKELVDTLGTWKRYVEKGLEKNERNFIPHLTVAIDLTPEDHAAVMKTISNNLIIRGFVKEIVLEVDGAIHQSYPV